MDMIPLQDAISALRGEILAARGEAPTEGVRFELGPIEMEFQVVARREIGGEAKLGFHIFSVEATVGGSGKGGDERTQKVKFVLNPVLVDTKGGRSKVDISREGRPEKENASEHTLERH
jgi:Trypsin-co-occurring domain 2